MKTNPLSAIRGIVLAATTAAVLANEPPPDGALETVYEDFARSGVFDLELSNPEANELVSQGLFGGTPRLVRLTLQAMAAHALDRGVGGTVVDRNFAAVPQLKEFLIAHWRTKVAEEGQAALLGEPDDVTAQVKEAIANGENQWVATVAVIPDWLLIPSVLAAYFPGDEEVHGFLWDDFAPYVPEHGLLMVFNEGRFKTPEVDQMRISGVDDDDHFTSVLAAQGVAFSRPEGGLDALISALRNYPGREEFLMDAIVSYGPEAIPLLEEIPESHPGARTHILEGLERLRKIEAAAQQ